MFGNNQHRFTKCELHLVNMITFGDVMIRYVDEVQTGNAIYSKTFSVVP